ncbi:glycosyltransferase, group 1 family protein [Aeromicrobium marinum DSM 15272]|uniref:Glycosyltransferase, group 1 family protein n=1 Tax=Aeromicrobium marinum DSM 15272 TaxID=585531 RepID=E2SFF8_9ACTN|nr:glycosyltransferase family 4 protein [Aeromicrobium marinum]EFQ82059.1 glycosyltransferase, group 1 family protein [Aeromicrobium marinum DSM 15272]
MRVAVLMTGLTAYQDTCFQQLSELGNDLLLVHPGSMPFAPFGEDSFNRTVQRLVWDDAMPTPDELLPVLEAFDPDVVIMWSWDGKGYRAAMKRYRGRALRVIFTSNFWHGSLKQWAGLLAGRFYVLPLFDAAWVPGERSELFARRIGFEGRQIIRGANSADTPKFDRGARDTAELAGRRRFLFTGRLIWHKAPAELAEAYRRYRELVDDPWDLDVAGDGPLRTAFEGVPGVRMHGFVQPADLADLMHTSSCFLLPSHLEWYGVVVHEAAVAGLPVICSDGVGAVPHLLQDGFNGWTVPAGDTEALTEAMVRMSSVDTTRLAAMSAGSRALGSRLSPTIWAQNLHEQLESRLHKGDWRSKETVR